MSRRATTWAAWLAWSLWALFIVFAAGLVLLGFLNELSDAWMQALASVPIALFPTVGAIVAARRPHNPMGWLILAIALSFAGSSFTYQYAFYTLVTAPGTLPGEPAMAWFSTWVGLPGSILLLSFFFLLFPTGHLPSPGWRAIAWFAGAMLVLDPLAKAVTPGNASWADLPVLNPLGIEILGPFLQRLNEVTQLLGIPIGALCAASILLRFRRARGDERQQLKWFAYAIMLVVLFYMLNLLPDLVPSLTLTALAPLLDIVFGFVISLPAIAIGIAILKYRLYDIDLIIRRTLIYGVLTATLALLYFGSVVVLELLLRPFTGQQHSDVVVVASTLLIAALFNPLRSRIQRFIDRRFYRRRYDAAKTLEAFSATLRDEVDIDTLAGRLVGVVEETMQPAHVSLWLREPGQALRDKRLQEAKP